MTKKKGGADKALPLFAIERIEETKLHYYYRGERGNCEELP